MELQDNLLSGVYFQLADLLETASREAQEKETVKKRRKITAEPPPRIDSAAPLTPLTHAIPLDSFSNTSAIPESDHSTTFTSNPPRYPNSFETPQKKREFSGSSMGQRSTETTPKKWIRSEAKVQSLLNTFVNTLVHKLWFGNIEMPWVQGRYMFMTYSELSYSLVFR